jgi:hypothetical protein
LPLPSFIDISDPENLHWIAVLGGSVVLSAGSSIVPTYVETMIDMRSHNRTRLCNETAARLHIIYITFLFTLITSDDFNKTGETLSWLIPTIITIFFILVISFIISGKTIWKIKNTTSKGGQKHECKVVSGVCKVPLGWKLFRKVCFTNSVLAFAGGLFCLGITVNPSLIKHRQSSTAQSGSVQISQRDVYEVTQATYAQIAQATAYEFQRDVLNIPRDQIKKDEINASYWIFYDGEIHLLSSTEKELTITKFHDNKSSIIGCGYAHQNHSVRWDKSSNQILIMPLNKDTNFKDNQCGFTKGAQKEIKYIVCTTYNTEETTETTVGICIFTESKTDIFVNDYRDFLREKAGIFYSTMLPLIKNKRLISPIK